MAYDLYLSKAILYTHTQESADRIPKQRAIATFSSGPRDSAVVHGHVVPPWPWTLGS